MSQGPHLHFGHHRSGGACGDASSLVKIWALVQELVRKKSRDPIQEQRPRTWVLRTTSTATITSTATTTTTTTATKTKLTRAKNKHKDKPEQEQESKTECREFSCIVFLLMLNSVTLRTNLRLRERIEVLQDKIVLIHTLDGATSTSVCRLV